MIWRERETEDELVGEKSGGRLRKGIRKMGGGE